MSKFKEGDTLWHLWFRMEGPGKFSLYGRTGIVTRTDSGSYYEPGKSGHCGIGYGESTWVEYEQAKGKLDSQNEDSCFHTKAEALEYVKADVQAEMVTYKERRDSNIQHEQERIARSQERQKEIRQYCQKEMKEGFAKIKLVNEHIVKCHGDKVKAKT